MWCAMFLWLRNQVYMDQQIFLSYIHCYFIHIYLRLNGECTIPYTLDYCNCCDYSAIDGLWTSGVSHTFNVCAGSIEAPQACNCFKGLEVINQQLFSYTIKLAKQ